jgi:hypothetical protein
VRVPPTHAVAVPAIAVGKALTVTVAVVIQPVGREYVTTEVPADAPVTAPVAAPIVATEVVPLIHNPPGVAEASVVPEPAHTIIVPEIADGNALTVTVMVRLQPVAAVYVIVVVPAATPVTTPVVAFIVATPVALLVHVPPVVVLVRIVVLPTQTTAVPPIVAGRAFMVIVVVLIQPVDNAYVIRDVPAPTPLTSPEPASIVAAVVLELVHVPPAGVDAIVEVLPIQMDAVPVIVEGFGLTVNVAVLTQPVDVSVKLIREVPPEKAATTPVVPPINATEPVVLTQVPAPDEFVNAVLPPAQISNEPPIAAGSAVTVTGFVVKQPVGNV